ncbi:MAG: LysM peptidoglycan-binding domain-containing protein [Parabacteroides sp.]|nr:LysM peptidoglycan-binding domain-containing protein [Parabacteroides sp.]
MVLIVLLFTSQNSVAQADEMVIETYRSEVIQPGETLWSLAEEYRLPDMPIEEYIKEVRRINQMSSNELVSGEYLILPIYMYEYSIS